MVFIDSTFAEIPAVNLARWEPKVGTGTTLLLSAAVFLLPLLLAELADGSLERRLACCLVLACRVKLKKKF